MLIFTQNCTKGPTFSSVLNITHHHHQQINCSTYHHHKSKMSTDHESVWDYWAPIFDGEFSDFSDLSDIINIVMSIVCITGAALAAGLTMGLMSLDTTKVELKTITGNPVEKAQAEKILPIIKQHHLLLVTLLLFNSISNESLPIFLGALFPNWLAILISVTMVLIFGEIIPSALFTGPGQMRMAANFIPFVKFLMTAFYVISYPIGKILDHIFGDEEDSSIISRDDFEAMVNI